MFSTNNDASSNSNLSESLDSSRTALNLLKEMPKAGEKTGKSSSKAPHVTFAESSPQIIGSTGPRSEATGSSVKTSEPIVGGASSNLARRPRAVSSIF